MARTCRDSGGDSGDSDGGGEMDHITTPPTNQTQPGIATTENLPKSPYDDEFTKNAINNATLPYFRNSQHKGNPETNSITNINFPKSASSWGPLHKPGHWKVNTSIWFHGFFLFPHVFNSFFIIPLFIFHNLLWYMHAYI